MTRNGRHALDGPLYVEVSPLLYPELAGIGRFVARLVEALGERVPLRLVTTVNGELAPRVKLAEALPHGWEISLSPADLPASAGVDLESWAHSLLRRPIQPHDPDVARRSAGLFTWTRPDRRHFRRELSLLYDFTPVLLPWAHLPITREYFGDFFARTIAASDKAVAISHSTKSDAAWLSALPPHDVVVGYPGPSLCPRTHAAEAPAARDPDAILVVSTLEPRKNLEFLLNWFANTRVLRPGTRLWWVGPDGWMHRHAKAHQRLKMNGREVRFLGKVPDRQLCALYRRAALTIYPSLYEGFGFPVLEALLHGTPVLSSFNSSLQEFAGPGVFYFDPYDPDSLDAAYRDLRQTMPLNVDRGDLRERCSWDGLARTVLELCSEG